MFTDGLLDFHDLLAHSFVETPLNKSWLWLESETAHSMWKQHTGMSSNEKLEQQFNLLYLFYS